MPRPIRRNDGKELKASEYKFPEPGEKSSAQEIADTLEQIMRQGLDSYLYDLENGYLYYDDDDSCIEMN